MRGFETSEFAARTAKAQAMMANHGLAALLLTTEPDVRYFTGYLTRFWESPTRPWFLIVPAHGKPVAVADVLSAPQLTEAARARFAELASGARLRLSPASADTDGFFAAVYQRAA
ncbi:MAG: aminopeptidase P family N-terminal domain-containing protein [Brevundimonas mediterranea]